MKVLTATRRTQGDRPGDFCWTIDGELVRLPEVICDRDQRAPDAPDACGCSRGFSGCVSSQATTTAEVVDLDMTREEYAVALGASMHREGWLRVLDDTIVQELVDELLEIADTFPVGAVLGHRLREVHWR
jgi:hypothetical protein